jgi:CelD/BcsL family acetyltransferase involved in cellulose biosynthesis
MYSFQIADHHKDFKIYEQAWREKTAASGNINHIFQSPLWFKHLLKADSKYSPYLGIVHNEAQQPLGFVPFQDREFKLKFDVASFSLWDIRLKAVHLLGSQSLVPDVDPIYDAVFAGLNEAVPSLDVIYLDSVKVDSFLWRYITSSTYMKHNFTVYYLDGIRPYYYINLPDSFENYMAALSNYTRGDYKKKKRRLERDLGYYPTLVNVESAGRVCEFLRNAVSISRNSWQNKRIGIRIKDDEKTRNKLMDLADRGLLRAYLLKCGETPLAFMLGYVFDGIYTGAETAYHLTYAKHSPGLVLNLLMIEDLIESGKIKILNYGIGFAEYKKRLSNMKYQDSSILLFRRSARNYFIKNSHALFRKTILGIRDLIKTDASHES